MDKTIRRVTDFDEQQADTYCYWLSRPVGERLVAVCELSQAAYAFAASFRRAPAHDDRGLQGSSSRSEFQRS